MCGRFVAITSSAQIRALFDINAVVGAELSPSWNIAPTQPIRMVAESYDAGAETGQRELRTVRWGLVPHWAKDPSIGTKMINARSETLTEKPSFKAAAKRRRCLIPAAGYYEWMTTSDGKTPYFLYDPHAETIAMAGLYEIWRDRSRPDDDPQSALWTATIITRSAPDALGHIHDRSPVVVPKDLHGDWLDCGPNTAAPQELLAAIPAPHLVPREVGRDVGNVRNNSADLIRPVAETRDTATDHPTLWDTS